MRIEQTILNVKQRFSSLSDAIKEVNLKLSKPVSQEVERLNPSIKEVFVTDDNKILFIYETNVKILDEFKPQHINVINENDLWSLVTISKNYIHISKAFIETKNINVVKKLNFVVTQL